MMRILFLIFILPIQVFSQEPPIGFVNFRFPKNTSNKYDLSLHYDLFTDSTCSENSYYGYLIYEYINTPIYYYPNLTIHLKDGSSQSDRIIPSIGYEEVSTTTNHPEVFDTIYKADEDSFFNVKTLDRNKICFALNDKINLWVKTTESIKFFKPSDFLTKVYPFEETELGQIVLPDTMELKKINRSDSIALNKVATIFLEALDIKDTKVIKNNSVDLIHCQLCNIKDYGLIIPLDSFINQSYRDFDYHLFESFKKRGCRISEFLIPNFHPKYLPNNYDKDLVVFEVRVMTYEPSELNDGHDGLNYCFYFVKINNGFKFFLCNSIPK